MPTSSPNSSQPIIQIIHGPNLNLLGEREPERYGHQTLAEIDQILIALGRNHDVTVRCFQSNHEGELIDMVQQSRLDTAGLIINPGGYTHTSVALRDALLAYPHPKIEVHLSNIHAREPFRRHSFVSGAVTGVICGLGALGYEKALETIITIIALSKTATPQ